MESPDGKILTGASQRTLRNTCPSADFLLLVILYTNISNSAPFCDVLEADYCKK
jgi:hypothetical protein